MQRFSIALIAAAQMFIGCDKNDLENDLYIECGTRYYYYGTEKVFLTEISNMGSISFYDILSPEIINEILENHPEVEILSSPYNSRHYTISIDSKNCFETDEIFNSIKKDSRVSNCNKFLMTKESFTFGITDVFICKLKSNTTHDQLMELIKKNEVEILKQDTEIHHYIIRADKKSNGDALEMANTFFESGLFEYSEANLFGLFRTF
ncbi:hypothetical protein CDL62_00900 [Alkalitalea saponilacus]|uniref:Uncharacterized protein n=2 Tax=Alkalitalea saponilacus TaxID=889453 RepID=A0A1T5HL66_9BACT|nr:hypothetical protein [Alkalitalea saponilacus]ASB47809.1 hypothetical protein CDL62_00900 [Alkalitalea saponilacus]SKC21412.1 hypothetical protein SAMN03080601_02415 [Alkalitalea saponilacus]